MDVSLHSYVIYYLFIYISSFALQWRYAARNELSVGCYRMITQIKGHCFLGLST